MQGYWNKPEQTAAVLRNGWYYSGDLGYMDDEGYVILVDRAKDMIVSGGENVYGSEVEEALYLHPAVLKQRSSVPPMNAGRNSPRSCGETKRRHRPRTYRFCREHIAATRCLSLSLSKKKRCPSPARARCLNANCESR